MTLWYMFCSVFAILIISIIIIYTAINKGKKALKQILIIFVPITIFLAFCFWDYNFNVFIKSKVFSQNITKPTINQSFNSYANTQYGFNFSLPDSWKGYTIVSGTWEGLSIGGQNGEIIVESGPLISIRHPRWTTQSPRQDIPIIVFTLIQWNSLQQGKFHIGAAPIGPSELGRNSSYVFALPARYNFSFSKGYEEVENILKGNPLQATKNN